MSVCWRDPNKRSHKRRKGPFFIYSFIQPSILGLGKAIGVSKNISILFSSWQGPSYRMGVYFPPLWAPSSFLSLTGSILCMCSYIYVSCYTVQYTVLGWLLQYNFITEGRLLTIAEQRRRLIKHNIDQYFIGHFHLILVCCLPATL